MEKIVIHTDADFTPKGARAGRVVTLRGAMGKVSRIRWYVGGRIYAQMAITPENCTLTRQWVASGVKT